MNDEQRAYWNGPAGVRWAEQQAALDHALVAFGQAVLEFADIVPGERVLDVGCGCGDTTLRLAQRVGPQGHVTGIDLSQPMLTRARERAHGAPNIELLEADASTFSHTSGAKYELAFSRFGVMFFADASKAFAQLRRQLTGQGRLAFVCWRAFADNPWASLPLAAVQSVMTQPLDTFDTSGEAPGPYSLADEGRIRKLLTDAGYQQPRIDRVDAPVEMGSSLAQAVDFALMAGPAARALQGAAPEQLERARTALTQALRSHGASDGRYAAMGSCWLVLAHA